MSKTIEVEIPFWGFYNSIHDDNIDRAIRQHYEDDQGIVEQKYEDAIYESNVDWDKIRAEYCKRFVEQVAHTSELDFEFLELTSPKEYNFESDRLFAKVPKDQIDRVRKEVEQYPNWATVIKETFSDRSGFWSNYSPDINHGDWTREDLDEVQWRIVIEQYFARNLDDDWQIWCGDDVLAYEMMSIDDAVDEVDRHLKEKEKGQKA